MLKARTTIVVAVVDMFIQVNFKMNSKCKSSKNGEKKDPRLGKCNFIYFT